MLRRVFLYCLRGWKKSVTLLVMCAVLFSVLLALFPIRRAASSAADALSLSLGTAFSMSDVYKRQCLRRVKSARRHAAFSGTVPDPRHRLLHRLSHRQRACRALWQ